MELFAHGITQNIEDLLQSHTARTMLANSEFIIMLNQASTDRIELAKLLNISEQELSYITNVGMSGSYLYKTQEDKYQYIKEIFNTLVIRDIKQKYKIRNTDIIQNLSDYLMDNISNLTSSNNIAKTLNSNNMSITDKTINNYIEYLCNAFAFYKIKRFDIKGKNILAREINIKLT